jgi:nucleotide-binding universal stress UspA family protein
MKEEMIMLPTRILLASDGSEEATRAARTAIELSNNLGAELQVVYVGHMPNVFYESPGAWALDRDLANRMEERAEDEALTVLEEQVRRVSEAGGKVAQAHAKVGRPDVEIVRLAEELGADLIVLGSRGLGPLRRALMGSVSESVLHHAHTSVLVAGGEPVSFPTKVLVALDGSEEAARAARTARASWRRPARSCTSSTLGTCSPFTVPKGAATSPSTTGSRKQLNVCSTSRSSR